MSTNSKKGVITTTYEYTENRVYIFLKKIRIKTVYYMIKTFCENPTIYGNKSLNHKKKYIICFVEYCFCINMQNVVKICVQVVEIML